MKVCAYVMRIDSGLAPNPFHGVCTLALCTPNHMRADLDRDDWILGLAGADLRKTLGSSDEWRIVYAMRVDERLSLNEYYEHPDFKAKIPVKNGSRRQQCGDNFYKANAQGVLAHTGESGDHLDEPGDIKGDRAFVGRQYWYFGRSAPQLPAEAWARRLKSAFTGSPRGIRYVLGGKASSWSAHDYAEFVNWLEHQAIAREPQPTDFDRWELDQCASERTFDRSAAGCSSGGLGNQTSITQPVRRQGGCG